MLDRRLLYLTAFLRALGTGAIGVLLGVYLAKLGLGGGAIGAVIAAGLAGAAAAALLAALFGDRIGRHRLLLLFSLLSFAGTIGVAFSASVLPLALFAFFGMVNGMGRDRGAALVLEQAALPALATPSERTRVLAWYTMLQDIGHAFGALAAGIPSLLERGFGWGSGAAHQSTLSGVALLALAGAAVYVRVGSRLDSSAREKKATLSPRSRGILVRISALFTVDSLAGGFLTTALLSYFFFERFGASMGAIALLFFGARVLNALSHLGAAWLARRIGLVNTMVFTHIPSSLLLVTVAFAPSFAVAAILFLIREGLVEMDVPTRQSYVLAVVAPNERTFASGITNLVRLGAWAVAPAFAGALMGAGSLHLPLVIGACMKILYDLLLWRAFRHVRPPEEEGPAAVA